MACNRIISAAESDYSGLEEEEEEKEDQEDQGGVFQACSCFNKDS